MNGTRGVSALMLTVAVAFHCSHLWLTSFSGLEDNVWWPMSVAFVWCQDDDGS